jgi:hypothetical protein
MKFTNEEVKVILKLRKNGGFVVMNNKLREGIISLHKKRYLIYKRYPYLLMLNPKYF